MKARESSPGDQLCPAASMFGTKLSSRGSSDVLVRPISCDRRVVPRMENVRPVGGAEAGEQCGFTQTPVVRISCCRRKPWGRALPRVVGDRGRPQHGD